MAVSPLAQVQWPAPAPRAPIPGFWSPAPRWVACSARLASRVSAFVGAVLRPSAKSGSGVVLVCVFSRAAVAGAFARAWSGRLGLSVAVRRSPAGFCVSVPVSGPVPAAPVVLPWAGAGAAAFWRALAGVGA